MNSVCDIPAKSPKLLKKEETLRKIFPHKLGTVEFRRQVQEICAPYVEGVWEETLPEPVSVDLLSGGLNNYVFVVKLPKGVQPKRDEPSGVVLRVYSNVDFDNYDCLVDTIISTLLGVRGLGPVVLGVLPFGRIEEHIPSRNLSFDEFCNIHVGCEIARILANVHSLEMPFTKRARLMEVGENIIARLRESPRWQRSQPMQAIVIPPPDTCPTEITVDLLAEEYEIAKKCLAKSGSPLVFSSNDVHEDNMLLRDGVKVTKTGFEGPDADRPLMLIDYEYGCFNYRGFDLCHYCVECCNSNKNPEWPGYFIEEERCPNEREQTLYIESYLDESEKIAAKSGGRRPRSVLDLPLERAAAVERLLAEIRRFTAFPALIWALWSWRQADEVSSKYAFFEYGFDRLALYYKHKPRMLEYLM